MLQKQGVLLRESGQIRRSGPGMAHSIPQTLTNSVIVLLMDKPEKGHTMTFQQAVKAQGWAIKRSWPSDAKFDTGMANTLMRCDTEVEDLYEALPEHTDKLDMADMFMVEDAWGAWTYCLVPGRAA